MIRRLMAVLLTWIVPGLGHMASGRVFKGLFFFVLIEGMFFVGLALGGFRTVSWERHPFYCLIDGLNGAATAISLKLWGHLPVTREILTLELGCLFAAVAGLLNVLVMIDAYSGPAEEAAAEARAPEPEGELSGDAECCSSSSTSS